jgi:hypothetical protein
MSLTSKRPIKIILFFLLANSMKVILALLLLCSFFCYSQAGVPIHCLTAENVLDIDSIEEYFNHVHSPQESNIITLEEDVLAKRRNPWRKGSKKQLKPYRKPKKGKFVPPSVQKPAKKAPLNFFQRIFFNAMERVKKSSSTVQNFWNKFFTTAQYYSKLSSGKKNRKFGKKLKFSKRTLKLPFELFNSTEEAKSVATKKLIAVNQFITSYIGPLRRGKCANLLVCEFNCRTLVNCPVKIDQTTEFMDLSKRVKANDEERKSYNWVCKNSIFSGKSQKDSTLSKLFRRIVKVVTELGDDQFEALHRNIDVTQYDIQYLKWIEKTYSGPA